MQKCDYCGKQLLAGEQCRCPAALEVSAHLIQAISELDERHSINEAIVDFTPQADNEVLWQQKQQQQQQVQQPEQQVQHLQQQQQQQHLQQTEQQHKHLQQTEQQQQQPQHRQDSYQPQQYGFSDFAANNAGLTPDSPAAVPVNLPPDGQACHQEPLLPVNRHEGAAQLCPYCNRDNSDRDEPVSNPEHPPVAAAVPPERMRGRVMMKVSGILLTVFAGLFIILTSFNILYFGREFLQNYFDAAHAGFAFHVKLMIYLAFGIIMAGSMLAFGIVGIVVSSNPKRGAVTICFGILLLIMNYLSSAGAFYLALDSFLPRNYYGFEDLRIYLLATGFFSVFFNSVLPILYIVSGAIKRKNRA